MTARSLAQPGPSQPRLAAVAAALALALPLAAGLAAPASAQTIAITGGTVHPVSGPRIERGTVLLRDGRVVAVGGADLAVPAGAERVDATGKWVTPGLFHPATNLGLVLTEIGAQPQTQEDAKEGDIDAAINPLDALNPAMMTLPVARSEGITTAVTSPSGGLVAGQSVVVDLDGASAAAMAARTPAAMLVDLGENAKRAGGGSRAGTVELLRRLLADAREFPRRRAEFERNAIRPLAASAQDLAALQPVLRGEIPMYVIANRRSDIETALGIGREFGLRLVIAGGVEAWQVADSLAARRVPVVVHSYSDIPSFEGPAARLDNAALLAKAGVPVLITDGGSNAHFRNLRYAAGEAVRHGLPWDRALAGITLEPARAFGLGERYGSLEAGKVANVVIWSGDPLDFGSHAERVWIRGREVPTTSRQTELLERYRTLPPKY